MQKGKLIIAGIVLTLSPALYAAGTTQITPAQEIVQAPSATPSGSESPMQDHVVDMMEKDFTFENQYRELNNQVALEKLRSELRKLRAKKVRDLQLPLPQCLQPVMLLMILTKRLLRRQRRHQSYGRCSSQKLRGKNVWRLLV
ncbi:MAG: hypothetical protein ACRCYL_03365 [Kluyvera sp.]